MNINLDVRIKCEILTKSSLSWCCKVSNIALLHKMCKFWVNGIKREWNVMVALGGIRTNNLGVFTCLKGEINQFETGVKKICCHWKQQGVVAWITLKALRKFFFQLLQKLPSLDRKMAKAFHQARISTVQFDKGNCPLTVICAAHV